MMENSERLIYCRKCGGIMPHEELIPALLVRCCSCGDRKKITDPHTVEAEIATQGDPRKV